MVQEAKPRHADYMTIDYGVAVQTMGNDVVWHNEQTLERAVKALVRNEFDACWVPTRQDACARVLAMIPAGARVGIGGSWTIRQIGLLHALQARGTNPIAQHWLPDLSHEEDMAIRMEHLNCDVFLTSSNAVTVDGQLVNIDGAGNRVGAMAFGPKRTILIAGVNKLVRDVAEGIWRTKNVAAPRRAHNLGSKTPCATTGVCQECHSPSRLCRVTVIIERKPLKSDITIMLVNEELGY